MSESERRRAIVKEYNSAIKTVGKTILSAIYTPNNARVLYSLHRFSKKSETPEDIELAYASGISPVEEFVHTLVRLQENGLIHRKDVESRALYELTPQAAVAMVLVDRMKKAKIDETPEGMSELGRMIGIGGEQVKRVYEELEDVEERVDLCI